MDFITKDLREQAKEVLEKGGEVDFTTVTFTQEERMWLSKNLSQEVILQWLDENCDAYLDLFCKHVLAKIGAEKDGGKRAGETFLAFKMETSKNFVVAKFKEIGMDVPANMESVLNFTVFAKFLSSYRMIQYNWHGEIADKGIVNALKFGASLPPKLHRRLKGIPELVD